MVKLVKDSPQENIRSLVDEYKKIFPDEYMSFLEQMKANVWGKQEDAYASVKNADTIERKLVEYPETLYTILLTKLSEADFTWFCSKRGIRWFAKAYREFRVAEKI